MMMLVWSCLVAALCSGWKVDAEDAPADPSAHGLPSFGLLDVNSRDRYVQLAQKTSGGLVRVCFLKQSYYDDLDRYFKMFTDMARQWPFVFVYLHAHYAQLYFDKRCAANQRTLIVERPKDARMFMKSYEASEEITEGSVSQFLQNVLDGQVQELKEDAQIETISFVPSQQESSANIDTGSCANRDSFASCETDRSVGEFLQWIDNGIAVMQPENLQRNISRMLDLFEVRHVEGQGLSVFFQRDFRKNEVFRVPQLLTIDEQSIISDETLTSPATSALKKIVEKPVAVEDEVFLSGSAWLSLYLLEHRRYGSASPWNVYIDLLPKKHPTMPHFFTDEDWKWLEGSPFVELWQSANESIHSQYLGISDLLVDFNRTYTIDDFLWADATVRSRAYGCGQSHCLLTMDLFNHKPNSQLVGGLPPLVGTWEGHSTRFQAQEDVPAGSEALISYGDNLCNLDLVLRHGFAIPNPPCRKVSLHVHLPPELPGKELKQHWILNKRLNAFAEAAVECGQKLTVKAARCRSQVNALIKQLSDTLPQVFALTEGFNPDADNFLGYFRILAIPAENFSTQINDPGCNKKREKEWFNQAAGYHRDPSTTPLYAPPVCQWPLSWESERLALQLAQTLVNTTLEGYPTSIQEDRALLPTLSGLPEFLVRLRLDEKLILQWWMQFLSIALDVLKSKMAGATWYETEDGDTTEIKRLKAKAWHILQLDRKPPF